MEKTERFCGILLHPTSFNSPFGIGDLGAEARTTLEMLAKAGVKLWQILPLGPTGYGDSPYASRSTFAGNELLIDLRSIEDISIDLEDNSSNNTSRVDYNSVYANKMVLLKEAASEFLGKHSHNCDYVNFCTENSWWLDDYALYQSLVIHFNDSRWFAWPEDIKMHQKPAVDYWYNELNDSINIYKALQFFFYKQWNALHEFANGLGLRIIGDVPFFVAADSADVWTNPQLFKIDNYGVQTCQAGVPPDAFSSTGQLWGNPVYNWEIHKRDDFYWWRKRMEMIFRMVDIVRFDHFRGFESYWEVPAGEPTATSGKWVKSPGMDLLKYFTNYNIIAEDLGVITDEVVKLRLECGFPGMKVLHFAFNLTENGLNKENWYLPYNYEKNSAAYTGTHDNQTSRGWFNSLSEEYKDIVRRFFQSPNEDIVWQMLRGLLASSAKYAIFPIQDLIGLDDSARMNVPSTVGVCNWSWRLDPSMIQDWMLNRLREYINLYGR